MLTGLALVWPVCALHAAGLGSGAPGAVLGQSLDYAVSVRLDAGESLGPECFAAEVSIGERSLPAGSVRVQVEPAAAESLRLRVLTNQRVDEPVVTVQLNTLCGTRASRRYVVLADPPGNAAAVPVAVSAVQPITAAALVPAFAAAVPVAPAAAPNEAASPAVAAEPAGRSAARADSRFTPPATLREVGLREGRVVAPAPRATRRAEARAAAAKRRAANAVARADAPKPLRSARKSTEGGPRLQLDMAPPMVAANLASATAVEQALEAVALAASAARQQASAASAAADRIAALERTVDQLRGEAKSNRDLSAQLREQLARAESSGSLTWFVTGVALLLATLAAWLGMRLSSVRRVHNQSWSMASRQAQQAPNSRLLGGNVDSGLGAAARPAPTAPSPFAHSDPISTQPPAPRSRPSPAWPPPAPPEQWEDSDLSPSSAAAAVQDKPSAAAGVSPSVPRLRVVSSASGPAAAATALARPSDSLSPQQATVALPPGARPDDKGHRDVSIDELLDLEQQAEFFVVLGQDDAAIDLLVEHLRHTGGGSPLPYLKLLEIYRRRGERSDYERMRARFNHRFNAYAPDWEVDLHGGRSLEDYAGVLPRLQATWARPLDSMAELEALLFRKSRGELFDLPAYREVLFLYALARDLLDRESADTGHVDLLLPLSSATVTQGEFSNTSPAPFDLGRDSQHGRADFEDRPTAPVDFDLTLDSDRPTSIFDALEERPPHPRRR